MYAAAGVASADDVQVRCTSSSVSIAVPDRYMLQLPLPVQINDQAESVKFSIRKQPPTLTVTMAVESSIPQQPAPSAPGMQPSTAAAASESSSTGSHSTPRQRGQQQQPAAASQSSGSTPATQPAQLDITTALTAVGPMRSEDRREWLLPIALVVNWMEHGGASEALQSLLWTLSLYDLPEDEDPQEDLVPLTLRNLVLALLGLLLSTSMSLLAAVYTLVGEFVQFGCCTLCMFII